MTARPIAPSAPFLALQDLLVNGVVSDETSAKMRALIAEDLRASLSPGAREAVADAYRAKGEEPPDWCLP